MDNPAQRRRSWSVRPTGCLLLPVAVLMTIVFWSDLRATAWYWQALVAVGYLFLLSTLGSAADKKAEVDSRRRAAATLLSEGRFDEALEQAKAGLAESSDDPALLYAEGKSLFNMQRMEEAERAWLKALDRDPSHGLAAADLGTLYMNQGEHMKAAERYEQARTAGVSGDWFDRNLRRLSNNLAAKGTELATGGDFVQAAPYFRRATDFGTPDHPFEHNLQILIQQLTEKGIVAEKAGNYELALQYSEADLSLQPDFAIAHAWKASHLSSLGQYEEAIKHWRRCRQLDSTYRPEIIEALIRDAEECLAKSGKLASPPAGDPSQGSPKEKSLLWKEGEYAFGRFQVRKIVHGGMGYVYCCWSPSERVFVALKALHLENVLSPERSAAPDKVYVYRDLFREEAKIWLGLGHHPNIVRLFTVEDFEHTDLVLCMEYIAGRPDVGPTLRDHLDCRGRLPPREAIRISMGICNAMQFAYDRSRLVHRDLKPENIFLTDTGLTKVGDFGLAVTEGDASALPAGTGPYIAPELMEARPATTMDIYAMGVVLHEMLAGDKPIHARGAGRRIALSGWVPFHRDETPPSLIDLGVDVPPCLSIIVTKCLAKAPEERYQRFADLRKALADCASQAGMELGSPDVSPLEEEGSFSHYRLGISLHNLGQHEESLSEYRKAVLEEPFKSRSSQAWCSMGLVLATLRRFNEAKTCFDKALQINPYDRHALCGIANMLRYTGRLDKALKAARRLIEVDPTYKDAYICEGWVYLKTGRDEEAKAAFEKALSLRSEDPMALTGLASRAVTGMRLNEANDLLERAVTREEDYAEAQSLLSDVLRLLHEPAKGLPHAERAVKLDPNLFHYRISLGMTLGALDRYEQAAEQLEKAVQLAPDLGFGWYALAMAYKELGRTVEALRCARRAVQLGYAEAQRLVDELEKRQQISD